ncbi:hypothetical protein AB5J62_22485 [Amycolatopsis sp. cg5]|uniref:hypothetical protein n=1 Tax=Amycolatopsis sp. cg5 TaxID=3238802 RepID=UPI003524194F
MRWSLRRKRRLRGRPRARVKLPPPLPGTVLTEDVLTISAVRGILDSSLLRLDVPAPPVPDRPRGSVAGLVSMVSSRLDEPPAYDAELPAVPRRRVPSVGRSSSAGSLNAAVEPFVSGPRVPERPQRPDPWLREMRLKGDAASGIDWSPPPEPVPETPVRRASLAESRRLGYGLRGRRPAEDESTVDDDADEEGAGRAAPILAGPPPDPKPRPAFEEFVQRLVAHPPRRWADLDSSDDLEEMAGKLYERLHRRLRYTMLVDRERSGTLADFA